MNEQIQKLIKQAMVLDDDELFVREVFDREKFAELIVRECAKIADDGYGSAHFGNGIAGYQLLRHFGVEE
jgi:hypothetical protein